MKKTLTNLAKNFSEKVYKYFGENSGKMLLATSIIGISTSCLAQTAAILCNKEYTVSQKAFMVPQELVEGAITVFSIFMVTKPIQKFSAKYVNSGKLLTKDLAKYLKNNDLLQKRGNKDFSINKSITEIIEQIEKSDKFINAAAEEKQDMLSSHKQALNDYDKFSDSVSAIAATTGSILSTTLIAPV